MLIKSKNFGKKKQMNIGKNQNFSKNVNVGKIFWQKYTDRKIYFRQKIKFVLEQNKNYGHKFKMFFLLRTWNIPLSPANAKSTQKLVHIGNIIKRTPSDKNVTASKMVRLTFGWSPRMPNGIRNTNSQIPITEFR